MGKLVPQLRFKGFTDPWEQRKLSTCLTESVIPGHSGDQAKKLTVRLWGKGVVEKTTLQNGSSATQYYVRKSGQLMYGKLDFLHAAFGIVPQELDGYESTADSPAFDIADDVDKEFVLQSCLRKELYLYQGSLADGSRKAKRVHSQTFLQMTANFPSLEEQQKITELFRTMDDLIAAHERKLELLRLKKRYYLQQIFSRKLRFRGFTEPWQQRKLGELYEKGRSGGTPNSENRNYYGGNIPFLGISDLNGRYITNTSKHITEMGLINSAAWLVPEGAISLAMYASVGKVGILSQPMATSQAFFNMVFPSTIVRNYIFARLDKAALDSEWNKLVSTGTQSNLNAQKIKEWAAYSPRPSEQRIIGDLFLLIDEMIELQEEYLSLMGRLKENYLHALYC
ncbi:restriction endonuclease subunit S [Bifidobacterium samirii]|uniref:Type I restriction endonuclease n=1 Tax=Bifidobacterium samirii TaxID=2306974 RepID=A0A430FU32_9BIFI|nr:restriction endonuclease subunit S [Bifidobacterium samirii]RSX56375.1 type I restriction endonuclease [Bifidobacterium samirii]